ncbi:MAG TPA: S8 family serine peptidase, partial [Anaerolineae bacterium]
MTNNSNWKRRWLWLAALLLVLGVLLAPSVVVQADTTSGLAGDLFLVTYEAGAKSAVAGEIQSLGGTVRHQFDNINVLPITLDSAAAEALAAHPSVVAVEVDPIYHPFDQAVPYGIDMVQARDTWDANRDGVIDANAPTGEGIRVCVVDTGIYKTHEDLGGGGVNIVAGRSWVNEDWARDLQGHGTHVAGTVGAMNNDVGVVGVSPGEVDLIIADVFNNAGDGQASSTILAAAN